MDAEVVENVVTELVPFIFPIRSEEIKDEVFTDDVIEPAPEMDADVTEEVLIELVPCASP